MVTSFDRIYRGVPLAQIERLLQFRAEHPAKRMDIAGVPWEYIACGTGMEPLLLLPGGLRVAENAFVYIQMFERAYRLIVPTYPPLMDVDAIVDGVAAILDAEKAQEAYVLGQSYGGMVAQVLLRRYPSRVKKLVLSSAGPLAASRVQRALLNAIAAVAPKLPEPVVKSLFKRMLLPVLSVPRAERAFWKAYLDDLFGHRLTKGDVLSHWRTGQDALQKYGFAEGETSSWGGEVLIIGGQKDPVSTAGDRRKLAEIYPQAQVHVIAGAGHTVAMAEPAQYAVAVKGFLDQR